MEALLLLPRAVSLALSPMTDGGLEPVVLKGPVVAERYPEPGLRPMEDIDVLLPRDQHPRALRLLDAAGWRVVRAARRDRYDTILRHREVPSLALELHYGLESAYERVTSLDASALWERRQPVKCMGTHAFALPLPEELVVLSAHAGKPYHGFSRLMWIADLAMIVGYCVEHGDAVDWERVESLAKSARCMTVVGTAFGLAAHIGVSPPSGRCTLPDRGWRASALSRLLDVTWPLSANDPANFHLRYALTDGWRRRTRLLIGSGHGMGTTQRLWWSVGAPAGALTRWWDLRRGERPGIASRSGGDRPRQDAAAASGATSGIASASFGAAEVDQRRRWRRAGRSTTK
jgi:hypothetical protein